MRQDPPTPTSDTPPSPEQLDLHHDVESSAQPPKVGSFNAVLQDLLAVLEPMHRALGSRVVGLALTEAGKHFDLHLEVVERRRET